MIMRYLYIVSLIFFSIVSKAQNSDALVNFKHLGHLTETIPFQGDTVDIVHIYANYPDYGWENAGEEGIACVDDAARAAVLYFRHYELTQDEHSLACAKRLVKFVMHMETGDGMFYNFVNNAHAINREGGTSFKSFGWWAARSVWSMSVAYRIFSKRDSLFANDLQLGIKKTFPHIDSLFQHYGMFSSNKGLRVPRWLLYGSGADATSELLLGLTEYYSATHDRTVRSYIKKLAGGLIAMQDGNIKTSPYGLHRSWETLWHMWGNGQTLALAAAGKVLNDKRMIHSAELEADGFYSRLLIGGFKKEMDVTDISHTKQFEQIAYGVCPMAVGLLRLYDATKNTNYLTLAGLASSWLTGNNVLHQPMYDAQTGRCFDGITDSISCNKNSGAESTIEALWTLTELEKYPLAERYLDYKIIDCKNTPAVCFGVFQNAAQNEVTVAVDLKKGVMNIFEGAASVKFRSQYQ